MRQAAVIRYLPLNTFGRSRMRNVASVVMWRWAWKGRPAAMERFSYAT